jgi:CubicO group peptidase (beta-lactamase class C family)
MSERWVAVAVVALLLILSITGPPTAAYQIEAPSVLQVSEAQRNYWPTGGWLFSTPEEQGMSSEYLLKMNETIFEEGLWFDAVIIVKNGYIVYEEYPSGNYSSNSLHILHSATKSITSGLMGVAITQEYIDNVSEKILDFFPDKTFQNMSPEKESITLEHILTMTPGLEWDEWSYPYDDPQNDLIASLLSGDTVQYLLDKPIIYSAGEHWTYNTGCSNLLIKIIERATGMTGVDYVIDNLFGPLGITTFFWRPDSQGSILGGHELWLRPRDMAKFGFLYLNNGTWNGEQIISSDYVATSGDTYVGIYKWHPYWPGIGYGYQWWTDIKDHYYTANGQDGQMIYVIQNHDLVVVFCGYTETYPYNSLDGPGPRMLNDYILPAIEQFNDTTTITTNSTESVSQILVDIQTLGLVTCTGIVVVVVLYMFHRRGKQLRLV